jgi:uroporphyrinogen decarboxylase
VTRAAPMTHRERILAVLRGEPVDRIPLLGECPMDVTVFKTLLPPPTGNPIRDEIAEAEFFDNSALTLGIGLNAETISRDETHHRYRYETGSVWHEVYQPTFNRDALEFPINTPEEALAFKMPDVHAPGRYDKEELTRTIRAYHDAGYFVQGTCLGAWKDIYYYLTSMDNILRWMMLEPEAARACFDMIGNFSIESARVLLDCGVDCLFTGSDLGSGQGLLFSPALFYEYVFPWLKTLAGMAHARGAYLHLHSHGHIQDIMDGLIEAGVDIVNPIGPSDHNDLDYFKKKWGGRIVIHGGMSTKISFMNEDEIRRHVREVMAIGRRGGRFIPRTESGIPPMSLEKALVYLNALKEERAHGF